MIGRKGEKEGHWHFYIIFSQIYFYSNLVIEKRGGKLGKGPGSVIGSPIHCTRKVSAGGSSLFKTGTNCGPFVLPRFYGCRGTDCRVALGKTGKKNCRSSRKELGSYPESLQYFQEALQVLGEIDHGYP